MIFQLHWQNISKLEQTIFVVEEEIEIEPIDWLMVQLRKHGHLCPDDHVCLLRWGNSVVRKLPPSHVDRSYYMVHLYGGPHGGSRMSLSSLLENLFLPKPSPALTVTNNKTIEKGPIPILVYRRIEGTPFYYYEGEQ
jgi:hypothetical protein